MKRILKCILLLMSIMSAISVACLAKDSYTQISQEEAWFRSFPALVSGYPAEERKQQDRFDESRICFVK